MRSGWFFGTDKWSEYQRFYFADRPRVDEYKSSPLANDDMFAMADDELGMFTWSDHQTQVIDLTATQEQLWHDVRKSYRPLINKAVRTYDFRPGSLADFHKLHAEDAGRETRHQGTWDCMERWMQGGFGGTVMAHNGRTFVAGAYFILYQGAAYYASGASLEDSVQHAVIWTAMKRLKAAGIRLLEMGQIDGETEKEKSIGVFKSGFGGKAAPFTIARRKV